ncbi:MAG: hypothetical protein ACT4PN_08765 [Nitrospiraceae bacterium]
MKFPQNPNKEIFTSAQNEFLRRGLRKYQTSVQTANRGGYLSWARVASDIQLSQAYKSVVVELIKADEPELWLRGTNDEFVLTREMEEKAEDRWPLLGKKLERFVDGEKSHSTGQRTRSIPEMWVRRVIYEFLLEQDVLPQNFHEKGEEDYSAAIALLNYFKTGTNESAFQRQSFTGTYFARKKLDGDFRPKGLRFEPLPNHSLYQVEGWSSHQTESAPEDHTISGWAIVPPGDGLLLFLKVRKGQEQIRRVYITHSIQALNARVQEFMLGAYGAQGGQELSQSIIRDQGESMFFISRIPVSFDRVEKVVKVFRKRTMRGEPAFTLRDPKENDREDGMPKRSLDTEFLIAVCEGNVSKVERLIPSVKNINVRVGGTEGTALHIIAKYQLIDVFKILRRRQDLNYLAKDNEGQLPSDVAMTAYNNVGLDLFLLRKERQQARREGIDYRAWAIDNVLKHRENSPT